MSMYSQNSSWKCHEILPEKLMGSKLCSHCILLVYSVGTCKWNLLHHINGLHLGVPLLWPSLACSLLVWSPLSLILSRGCFFPFGIACSHVWIYIHSLMLNKSCSHSCNLRLCFEFLSHWGKKAWNNNWGEKIPSTYWDKMIEEQGREKSLMCICSS